MKSPPREILVSGPVLCEAIGVSLRHLTNLERDGIVKKEGRGQYNFTVSVRAFCEYLRKQAAPSDDYEANRARKMKADAELSEIAVERERGRLFDAARTKKTWEGVVMHARAKLLGLPERIGQQVLTAPDVAAAKKILAKEINETLEALAECRIESTPDVLTPEPEVESETADEETETDDTQD